VVDGLKPGSIEPRVLGGLAVIALLVSAIQPADRLTWWLEAVPVVVGLPLLALTYRWFSLTPLSYRLLFLHALILLLGAHYTYSQVPIGFAVQELFGFERNHYDRLGHLAQGFVPAIVAREVLLRCSPLERGAWLFFLVTCFCLAFSAFYEMIEWWVAVLGDFAAEAFLATQGDVWDTQWDMFLALIGALIAQLLLGRLHDRQLARMGHPAHPADRV